MENNLQFINDSWRYVSKSVNLNNFTFSCTLKGREVFHLKKKQKKKQMTKKAFALETRRKRGKSFM